MGLHRALARSSATRMEASQKTQKIVKRDLQCQSNWRKTREGHPVHMRPCRRLGCTRPTRPSTGRRSVFATPGKAEGGCRCKLSWLNTDVEKEIKARGGKGE